MDVVYGGTSPMLGVFSSFTSLLARPFLPWSPYLLAFMMEEIHNDGTNYMKK
ncbi:hypothetical protein HanRHA438_Chr14g0645611 [Helianthus annuus]|nr:hypothetical protein HanHA89_Chr14g0564181 [Helianthus annuus]KAJ0655635.1 hypothetical protein HanLR1_Chr14g0526511 [Helianthus annuus]KAJ0659323.1 hypothetical protein HanOQP8_Chr14g0524761 [Helianthus annuus]KAJ0852954.1 hypothetical protein HanRHA438_Chr14g0645611 [Helianthus annuus]